MTKDDSARAMLDEQPRRPRPNPECVLTTSGHHCPKCCPNCPDDPAEPDAGEFVAITTAPFRRYTRTVVEVKEVATVTAENIGQIAALIGGSVDYSGDEPILVVPKDRQVPKDHQLSWRVRLGSQVSRLGDTLMNQNGFNSDGTWAEEQAQ